MNSASDSQNQGFVITEADMAAVYALIPEREDDGAKMDYARTKPLLSALLVGKRWEVGKDTEPAHFEDRSHALIFKIIKNQWQTTGTVPPKSWIVAELTDKTKSPEQLVLHKAELDTLTLDHSPWIPEPDYFVDFLKEQSLKVLVSKTIDVIGNPTKACETMRAGLDAFEQIGTTGKPKTLGFGDVLGLPDPVWLVEGMIPEKSLCCVYGDPESYKTFFALDLALCVASGTPLHGTHEVQAGSVLYIAGEGVGGIKKRLMAWQDAHSVHPDQLAGFKMLPGADLSEPTGTGVKEVLRIAREEYTSVPTLIVIDTMARAFSGDENSVKDVSLFIKSCDKIKAELGATVLLVHHTGKDGAKGARGSSSLLGAVDTMVEIRRATDRVTVTNKKMKDAERFNKYALVPQKVGPAIVLVPGDLPAEQSDVDRGQADACRLIVRAVENGSTVGGTILEAVRAEHKYGEKYLRERVDLLVEAGVLCHEKKKYGLCPLYGVKLEDFIVKRGWSKC